MTAKRRAAAHRIYLDGMTATGTFQPVGLAEGACEGTAMSYDLMVFNLAAAPKEHAESTQGYDEQTGWSEDNSYAVRRKAAPGR